MASPEQGLLRFLQQALTSLGTYKEEIGTLEREFLERMRQSGFTIAADGTITLTGGHVIPVTLADGSVTSAKIADDTIVNADVNSAAAIAWSKISKVASSLADLATRSAADLSSGTLPLARLSGITNTEIDAAAAIAWTKISKAASSLADLATRSAGDLSSGNLAIARLPTGGGTWAMGGNLALTGGHVTNTEQLRSSAYHNATQSLTTATWTALSLNSEDYDVGSMHDTVTNNSRITVPSNGSGLYLIIGGTEFTANATGGRGVRLRLNGTTVISTRVTAGNAGASSSVALLCMAAYPLSATDYLEVMAFQDSGGNLNVGSATRESASQLQLVKLW